MDQNQRQRREQIQQEAAGWVIRLSSEDHSEQDRHRFEVWREQSIDHEIAYERELAAWEALDSLARQQQSGLANPALDQSQKSANPPIRGRSMLRRWGMLVACFLLLAGVNGILGLSVMEAPAYATAIGERRLIRLQDGSTLELNTDTQIIVHSHDGTHVVDLIKGETMLRLARDTRPITIRALGVELEAVRGAVAVRQQEAGVQVMVKEGHTIARLTNPQGKATTLGRNSRTSIRNGTMDTSPLSAEQVERLLAWRDGTLIFDGERLVDAVKEFNRYNVRKISIDPSIENIKIGGYFEINSSEAFAKSISKAFQLEIKIQNDGSLFIHGI